jgi:hypothetical protein
MFDDGVDWYRPNLRRCLPASCTAHVGVEFEISIATDGTVDDVKTLSGDPKLTKCMERVLRKWGYPKSDCPQKERRPFAFTCESGRWKNH